MMVHPEDVAAAVVREVAAGKSRTVFIPELVGLVARASTVIPAPILDLGFRLAGGHRVTSDHDRAERAAYQARVEGKA
jgi:hypothetical protein